MTKSVWFYDLVLQGWLACMCMYELLCSFNKDNCLSPSIYSFVLFFKHIRRLVRKRKVLFIGLFISSITSFSGSTVSSIGSPDAALVPAGVHKVVGQSFFSWIFPLDLSQYWPFIPTPNSENWNILRRTLFTYLFFLFYLSRDGSNMRSWALCKQMLPLFDLAVTFHSLKHAFVSTFFLNYCR